MWSEFIVDTEQNAMRAKEIKTMRKMKTDKENELLGMISNDVDGSLIDKIKLYDAKQMLCGKS